MSLAKGWASIRAAGRSFREGRSTNSRNPLHPPRSSGQVAISDHVDIEAGSMLAARTGVHGNLKRGIYASTPAIKHRDFLRSAPLMGRLPELFKRIKELEQKLEDKDSGEEQS